MRLEQEKVRLFMEKIHDTVNDAPTLVSVEEGGRRYRFIIEEAQEYLRALDNADLVEIADAIGDLLYVVIGAAILHGLDLQSIFDEIHRSNMTKSSLQVLTPKHFDDIGTRSEKRCAKGPNYEPPRLAAILFQQKLLPDVPDVGSDIPGGGANP